jgi:hypothetical protein
MGQGYIAGAVPFLVLEELVRKLRQLEASAGLPLTRIVARGIVRLREHPQGPSREPLSGDLYEILQDVESHRGLGIDELILDFNSDFTEQNESLTNKQIMSKVHIVAAACSELVTRSQPR